VSSARARYRIVRPLVGGGNAEVFEALAHGELGFTRRVAIKRLRAELAGDADAVRSFIDEAKLVSRLHHANIVGVVDVGTLDGAPFQVMELVDGPDLRTLVEETRAQGRTITPELALHVAIEVAHALDHAHRAVGPTGRPLGIVHRDVSPDNILVSEAGDVKLADFGIAKQDDDAPKTRVGVAKGKPSYMAPEQHLGARLDARTDLFALGLVLHFVLAGRSPLEDDGARRAVIAGDPVPLDPALPSRRARISASTVLQRSCARPRARSRCEAGSTAAVSCAPRSARVDATRPRRATSTRSSRCG
jgi:serine/threonine-protein kinase